MEPWRDLKGYNNQDWIIAKATTIDDGGFKTQLELEAKTSNGLQKVRISGHNMSEFNSASGRPSCLSVLFVVPL